MDIPTLKGLTCIGYGFEIHWDRLIRRVQRQRGPTEVIKQHFPAILEDADFIDAALLVCVLKIARLPHAFSAYKGTTTHGARRKLAHLRSAIARLQKEIAGSAHLLPRRSLAINSLSASGKSSWSTLTPSPVLSEVLDNLDRKVARRSDTGRWTDSDKVQFYIDGVLEAFDLSFGFAYPSFAAQVASRLVDNFAHRPGVKPTSIDSARVLARAKKLKIRSR